MTSRTAQLVALVAAVVLLVGSVVGMVAWTAARDDDGGGFRLSDSRDRWRWDGDGSVDDRGPGSMMRGRMMDGPRADWMMGWDDGWRGSTRTVTGDGPVDEQGAQAAAQKWVDTYAAGADLGEADTMPMGYWFRATEDGDVVAVIMVDDDTGTVTGHLLDTWTPAGS